MTSHRQQLADQLADVRARLASRNLTGAERDELLAARRELLSLFNSHRRQARRPARPPSA